MIPLPLAFRGDLPYPWLMIRPSLLPLLSGLWLSSLHPVAVEALTPSKQAMRQFEETLNLAQKGDPVDQFNLALCYEQGDGVTQDWVKAAEWYRKAALQGDPYAQLNLGMCYVAGHGVQSDQRQAFAWFLKSAEQGQAFAQTNVGNCYLDGEGVDKDAVKAVAWYRKAAAQGDPDGQNNLGNCHANGTGVPKDLVEAVRWYRRAAEQGDAHGQSNLALSYARGEGVGRDVVEAFALMSLAARNEPEAASKLEVFRRNFPATVPLLAEKRIRELEKKPKGEKSPPKSR